MEEHGKVFVKKCKILGNNAYIVRAEKNMTVNGDYNLDTIEIVCNINLRQKYNLEDGNEISIEI